MPRISQQGAGTTIVDGVTSLPMPPLQDNFAYVHALWNSLQGIAAMGANSEGDLEIWSQSAVDLTDARLYGAVLSDQVLADDDVDTVVHAAEELTITGHAYATGDGPVQLTTTDTLPTGLALATDYYIWVKDANTIKLCITREDAMQGQNFVTFDDVGVGTHTVVDTASTQRARWMDYGLLGAAADGAISLTAFASYAARFQHKPTTIAYAVGATLSSAVAVYARVLEVKLQ